MPLYEYKCKKCGYAFQDVFKIAEMDAPTTLDCTKCGERSIERLFPSQAPSIADPYRLGLRKPHKDLTDRLAAIKKNNPGSTIKV